jgi:putative Mn2+ efflux pump MntP
LRQRAVLSKLAFVVLAAVLLIILVNRLSSLGVTLAVLSRGSTGQVLALLLMAAALGTDAMSLAIGIGLRGISRREGIRVSLVIGLFHIIMPLIGTAAGGYLSRLAGGMAQIIGAAIVAFIGIRMVWGCLTSDSSNNQMTPWKLTGVSLLLLALSVSIDALSVGLGLGAFGYNIYLTSTLFGLFGAGMTAAGLFLGRKMGFLVGKYGELVGGGVLIILALKMFLEGYRI